MKSSSPTDSWVQTRSVDTGISTYVTALQLIDALYLIQRWTYREEDKSVYPSDHTYTLVACTYLQVKYLCTGIKHIYIYILLFVIPYDV